jgi:hypothetical protein
MLSSRLFQSIIFLTKKEFLYCSDLASGTFTLLLLIRDCLVTIFVEMQLSNFFGLICLFPSFLVMKSGAEALLVSAPLPPCRKI